MSLSPTSDTETTAHPGLQRYLMSLSPQERRRASERLAELDDADLAGLGVSEPQPVEYDYRVARTGLHAPD